MGNQCIQSIIFIWREEIKEREESFRNIGCPRKRFGWVLWQFRWPYYEINPFHQGEVHFNITSEVNCVFEEYVEKEITFAAIDDHDDNDHHDDDS